MEYCLHPVTANIGLTDDDGNAILESCGTTGNCYTAIKEKLKCRFFKNIKLSTENSIHKDNFDNDVRKALFCHWIDEP